MIVFDLACSAGHVFEAWFGSSDDYEGQRGRGLVQCPLCGSGEVGKAVMAPRLAAKGNRKADAPPPPASGSAPAPASSPPSNAAAPPPAEIKAMLARMAEVQGRMLAQAAYVGPKFADKARAMHLGETDHAPIYGEVTREDAAMLHEEGVPVAPLLLPVRPPGHDN